MSPRPQRDPTLVIVACALLLMGYVLLDEARKRPNLVLQARAERNRRLEAEEEAERRRQQLDGALERIEEMKGEQPDPAAGE